MLNRLKVDVIVFSALFIWLRVFNVIGARMQCEHMRHWHLHSLIIRWLLFGHSLFGVWPYRVRDVPFACYEAYSSRHGHITTAT